MKTYSSPSPIAATGILNEAFGINHSNWDTAEFLGHAFMHTEQILPSIRIHAGEATWQLQTAAAQLDFDVLQMRDPLTGQSWSLNAILERRIFNSGILILHKGQVVHESYRNGMQPQTRHLGQSTSKFFVAMLVGIAIDAGKLDPAAPVQTYVIELREKPVWEGVSLRHVLDMTAGIRYTETYNQSRQRRQILDARAAGIGEQVTRIDQDRLQAGIASAFDISIKIIADVNGLGGRATAELEGRIEDFRCRLPRTHLARGQSKIKIRGQPEVHHLVLDLRAA